MDTEKVIFTTNTNDSGRVAHYAEYGTLMFRRCEILKSGRSAFLCVEQGCTARLYAKYSSKQASYTEELPILAR